MPAGGRPGGRRGRDLLRYLRLLRRRRVREPARRGPARAAAGDRARHEDPSVGRGDRPGSREGRDALGRGQPRTAATRPDRPDADAQLGRLPQERGAARPRSRRRGPHPLDARATARTGKGALLRPPGRGPRRYGSADRREFRRAGSHDPASLQSVQSDSGGRSRRLPLRELREPARRRRPGRGRRDLFFAFSPEVRCPVATSFTLRVARSRTPWGRVRPSPRTSRSPAASCRWSSGASPPTSSRPRFASRSHIRT